MKNAIEIMEVEKLKVGRDDVPRDPELLGEISRIHCMRL